MVPSILMMVTSMGLHAWEWLQRVGLVQMEVRLNTTVPLLMPHLSTTYRIDVVSLAFENYVLEQEFYESAMNGIQWIIDNKDTAWAGVDEELHGIDIISLSWGITSHEGGGSDGGDMHSRILDEATLAGVTVSVAAGNDGPDNEGSSGMGSRFVNYSWSN